MIPGSANPLLLATAAPTGPYTISRSLRFNSADSAYLSRTPASAGNRKTWTWAGWVKRSKLGTLQGLFTSTVTSGTDTNSFDVNINASDTISIVGYSTVWRTTTQVFRDPSAWYHIVISTDTTSSTADNRIRLYVNGSEVTTFATKNNPTQNADLGINDAAQHSIGSQQPYASGRELDGYLADVHFIDGQALDPTSFGEFSATTGVWMPKAFTGSYGTNGFKLDFADNSAATAAALGKDTSGNGNNFTPTNLSVTAGAGNDSLIDVPVNGSQTDTGVGGEVRGNYCTLNPLDYGRATSTSVTLSNGNLEASLVRTTGTGVWVNSTMEIPRSGKWYAEVSNATSTNILGIASLGINNLSLNSPSKLRSYYGNSGTKISEAAEISYGATYTTTDIIGIAVNMDAGTITFYKNNTSQGTAYSDLLTAGVSWCFFAGTGGGGTNVSTWNFGQRPFAYTAPSGFKALCTANLPAPTIVKPSTVMDVVLYTADVSGGKTISMPGGFSPDLVWIKNRDNVERHYLIDKVRGDSTFLNSNTTDSEAGAIAQLNGTSLTLGNSSYTITDTTFTQGEIYFQNRTYASWCWDGGSSTVSNTAGTITSSVRANASAGFSVVTYTGTGSTNASIGHGLGVAPQFIITKRRDTTNNWLTWHGTFAANDYIALNLTSAKNYGGGGTTTFGGSSSSLPTSTVFYVGADLNPSTATMVAYCFAPVAGYSAFGSYTGNGSADGPFVFCNFRPRWVMVKETTIGSGTSNWVIKDNSRPNYNATSGNLYANLSNAEDSTSTVDIDITSNGFKIRGTYGGINTNNSTHVWAAFAESPFQYSRAR